MDMNVLMTVMDASRRRARGTTLALAGLRRNGLLRGVHAPNWWFIAAEL
jgi:hypothetical protein